MAKRKNQASKKSTKSKSKRKEQDLGIKVGMLKLIGPLFLSLFIAYSANQYRGILLNWIHEYNCVEYNAGDFAAQIVYNAINLQHQIRENPNKEEELLKLLNDEVIWFRKSRTRVPKRKIRTYSKYDAFCFAEYPIYDIKDDYGQNYEMRFTGYHRLREIDSIMVKVEKYYCKLENGKISDIYSVPMNSLEKESFENTNHWYNRIFIYTFGISIVLIFIIKFIIGLPEGIHAWLKEIATKYLPL